MTASARNPESHRLHHGGARENDDPLLCFFVFTSLSTVSPNLKACELKRHLSAPCQPHAHTHTHSHSIYSGGLGLA